MLRHARVLAVLLLACGCGDDPPAAPSCTTCAVGPPALTCPASIAQTTASYTITSVPVTYTVPSPDGGTSPVTTTCALPPGASFPKGTTTVTCKTVDSINRQAICTFDVTINVPPAPTPVLSGTKFLAFG